MPVKTTQEITNDILTQLRLLDPAISAEVGTPERKIIEAIAEKIGEFQIDFSVLESQHDLEQMAGGRLDSYLGNFGFARQQSTPAAGVVTFSRDTPAVNDILISVGTQLNGFVDSDNLPDLVFTTIETVTLAQGDTQVSAAVRCSTPGTVGNLPSGTITSFAGTGTILGITKVNNDTATTGGSDGEADADFKVRFKNTIFRNVSGTYDQYMALAVAQESVTKANVVGPISRYQEYIQVPDAKDVAQRTIAVTVNPTSGAATSAAGGYDNVASGWTWPAKRTSVASSIPYSKLTYDQNYYLTDGNLGAQARFFRPFVDYVFNAVPVSAGTGSSQTIDTTNYGLHKPNITILDAYDADDNTTGDLRLAAGSVLLLEHAYISQSSRNDYFRGILNCVDVFVNGSKSTQVNSQEIMPGTANVVQTTDATKWTLNTNFTRALTGGNANAGNKLLPLYWQPMVAPPEKLNISDGTTTYTFYLCRYKNPADSKYYYDQVFRIEGNYFFTEETTGYYGTMRARNAIEFRASVNGYLPNGNQGTKPATHADFRGAQFAATSYLYDANISNLQAIMNQHKQITTDVLVHRAKQRYFKLYITVMYAPGVTQSVVNAGINAAVANFFNSQYYGAAIQLSDILQAIHSVVGVDNVRWTKDAATAPGTVHRIEEVYKEGTSLTSPTYFDADFFIKDSELAASPDSTPVVIAVKAQNTWGTF